MAQRIFMNAGPRGRYGGSPALLEVTVHRPSGVDAFVGSIRTGREVIVEPIEELLVPDGHTHILFDLAGSPTATVHGPTTEPARLRLDRTVDQIGIEIAPGAVAAILGVPAWTLRNRTVDLEAVWGDAAEEWCERLLNTPPLVRVHAAADLIRRHASRSSPGPDRRAALTVRTLRRGPRPGSRWGSVDELAAHIGLGARQLEQVFRDNVGLSPKEILRLSRFRRLCALLTQVTTASFADHAHTAGYADQAHAAREVKRITGHTMSQLRDLGFFQDPAPHQPNNDGHDQHQRSTRQTQRC